MIYAAPGQAGAKVAFKAQYNNFIGGKFVAPVKGQYFDVITPTTGKVTVNVPNSNAAAGKLFGRMKVTQKTVVVP